MTTGCRPATGKEARFWARSGSPAPLPGTWLPEKAGEMDGKQTRPEIEILIQSLLAWMNEQPEYITGNFPDEERILSPVDKLKLACHAEQASNLCPPDTDWPLILSSDAVPQDPLTASVRNLLRVLGENSVSATLLALTGLLDVLCKCTVVPMVKIPKRVKAAWDNYWYAVKRKEPLLQTEDDAYEWLTQYGTIEGTKLPPNLGDFKDYLKRYRRLTKEVQAQAATLINPDLRKAIEFHAECIRNRSDMKGRLPPVT